MTYTGRSLDDDVEETSPRPKTDMKGGEKNMQQLPSLALLLAQDQRQRQIDAIARERRLGRSSRSVRQAVGRRIIAIGARVAADPSLELARFR